MAKEVNLDFGPIPEPMSKPMGRFHVEQARLVAFQNFMFDLVKRADTTHETAAKALLKTAQTEEQKQIYRQSLKHVGHARLQYLMYDRLILELFLCRYVDNYLCYISEIIALVFTAKPETLRSSETVTVEEVLSCSTLEDFVGSVAENRVHQLSYKGLDDLSGYLADRLGLELFESADDLGLAKELIEVRNLIVHNRGIINEIFSRRVPAFPGKPGDQIDLSAEYVVGGMALLSKSAVHLEIQAAAKFELPQPVETKVSLAPDLMRL